MIKKLVFNDYTALLDYKHFVVEKLGISSVKSESCVWNSNSNHYEYVLVLKYSRNFDKDMRYDKYLQYYNKKS